MKKNICLCAVLLLSVCLSGAVSAKIDVPGRTASWVNDYAGVISEGDKKSLEQLLSSIPQKTPDPVEVVVATFKSLEGWDTVDFAAEYGEKWREAKKRLRDNGVLILVVLDERRVFIGVGKNLTAILPPVVVGNIIQKVIVPKFSKGRPGDGLRAGAEAVIKILEGAEIPKDNPLGIIVISVAALLGAFYFFIIRKYFRLKKPQT